MKTPVKAGCACFILLVVAVVLVIGVEFRRAYLDLMATERRGQACLLLVSTVEAYTQKHGRMPDSIETLVIFGQADTGGGFEWPRDAAQAVEIVELMDPDISVEPSSENLSSFVRELDTVPGWSRAYSQSLWELAAEHCAENE